MNNEIVGVDQSAARTSSTGRQGHGWMMIGCAVMLALVLVLVATGTVGATLLLGALACMAMMAVMMLMMSRTMGGHDHRGKL